jgi:protein-tyrosine phosphatase
MVKRATAAELLEKHSPIKNGLVIKNEDRLRERYNEIEKGVFLGNYRAAKDKEFIKNYKIKAVLNCSKDIPNYHRHLDIEYVRIPIDDSLKKKDIDLLYDHLNFIVEFIKKHVNANQNIFIHCYAGRQRSAASVAAYLMNTKNISAGDACRYILSKRKEAFHYGLSLNFENALCKYEKALKPK